MTVWALATVGTLELVLTATSQLPPGGARAVLLIVWVVFMFGGIAPIVTVIKRWQQRQRLILVEDFLRRISYSKREPFRDDDSYRRTWMTGTHDPARFYSYSKSQRDFMKMTGMTADDYYANMPD